MEPNKTDKNFAQQQPKKDMPEKRTSDISGANTRPEIDLPVKGGARSDADLSSKTQPQRDIQKNAPRDEKRETR